MKIEHLADRLHSLFMCSYLLFLPPILLVPVLAKTASLILVNAGNATTYGNLFTLFISQLLWGECPLRVAADRNDSATKRWLTSAGMELDTIKRIAVIQPVVTWFICQSVFITLSILFDLSGSLPFTYLMYAMIPLTVGLMILNAYRG